MPAKTVVFTNARKFDGDKFRWISSGEYIQMSGRAGRRGIDDKGIVILMVDGKLEAPTVKSVLKGFADPLKSAFQLTYNMLLNQMRSEDADPETLLQNSFYQFQADRALPDLEKQVRDLEVERDSIVVDQEGDVENYYDLLQQYKNLKKDIRDVVFSPKYCLPFLQTGRLVYLKRTKYGDDGHACSVPLSFTDDFTWGVILNFQRMKGLSEDDNHKEVGEADYTVDVLTKCISTRDETGNRKAHEIVPLDDKGEPVVTSIPISQIEALSLVRVVIPKDLIPVENREKTLKVLVEVLSRFSKDGGVPLLDAEEDMKVQCSSFRKARSRIEALESLFDKQEIGRSPEVEEKLRTLERKKEMGRRIKAMKRRIRASTVLAFRDELKSKRRVLRRLGYTTRDGVVEVKGKVACEISSADELTLTELFFSGVLKDTSAEEMLALLSCFVWQERLHDALKPRDELSGLLSVLHETARRVASVQLECKVCIDVDAFVRSFRPDIMEPVFAWASGSKFSQVMDMSPVFEGSLIRAIRRLEEVLQQLIRASLSVGDADLHQTFTSAVLKIKRDIVFAASLYL